MRKSLLIAICLLVSFAVVASFSCRKASQALGKRIAEKAIEGASGGKAKVDLGATGNVDISGLPEALRYPGAKAVGRWSSSDATGQGAAYVFETADPIGSVTAFYTKAMAGWKSSMNMQTDKGTVMGYASADDKQTAVITVAADDAKKTTSLTIVYGTKQ
jgi:hypothetical protein